jgi:hypothetical protein
MNLEASDLLARVDQWKFKLHDKLAAMTPAERAAFWNQIFGQAAALGTPIARQHERAKPSPKQDRRRTG